MGSLVFGSISIDDGIVTEATTQITTIATNKTFYIASNWMGFYPKGMLYACYCQKVLSFISFVIRKTIFIEI